MAFPVVSQPETNDYRSSFHLWRKARSHLSVYFFFNLFSIIAFWYAITTRRVILYNLRENSADDLIFDEDIAIFVPGRSLVGFRPICLLDEYSFTAVVVS
jgi:hypothetical protein